MSVCEVVMVVVVKIVVVVIVRTKTADGAKLSRCSTKFQSVKSNFHFFSTQRLNPFVSCASKVNLLPDGLRRDCRIPAPISVLSWE